ncbi:Tetratricopeptide repeat protein 2 [Carabus blaptoides fortunei]
MDDILKQAELLFEENQHEYAIFLLTDAIQSAHYDKAEALCKRSACYMHMNRYRDACSDLTKAIELDRTIPSAYVRQSKCYLAMGDLENAICSLEILRSIDPDSSFAKFELEKLRTLKGYDIEAKALFARQKYSDVVNLMDKCLERAEICIKFKLMKAECLVYLREHEQAVIIVNEVLFLHKDDIEAICIRAMNLLHQEKYQLGMIELKEVLTISAKATQMFKQYKAIIEKLKRADKALQANRLEEARCFYEEVLRIDTKNVTKNMKVHLKLAELHQRLQQYKEAIEYCTRVLEIEPSIMALKIRAECNFDLEDFDVSVEDYRELVKLDNTLANKSRLDAAQKQLTVDNDPCKLFGISASASAEDIKKIYRKLIIKYHPDKHPDESKYVQYKMKVRFARIQQAYEKLKRQSGK